jgi:membrane peptidoglycan carboxypeptidase
LNKDETIILNQLLRSPFDSNVKSYTSPTLLNYQTNNIFAAKTGTTDNDSWTIGFNPKYTISVWVGSDDNQTLINASLSRKIFQDIANSIDTTPSTWYDTTKNIEIKRVNPISGNYSSTGSLYYFAKA